MAVPDWVSYLSLGGGVFGTVLGVLNYRRTSQLKALDLRLELRQKDQDARSRVEALSQQMEYAKQSRERVSAATGSYQSGAMKQWVTAWEADELGLRELQESLPVPNNDYRGVAPTELESELVRRHELLSRIDALAAKYSASIAQDDKRRDEIRNAMRAAGIRQRLD